MTNTPRPSREIDGKSRTIRELLAGRKYSIDYYQREYRWQQKQVAEYDHYFLGRSGPTALLTVAPAGATHRGSRGSPQTGIPVADLCRRSFGRAAGASALGRCSTSTWCGCCRSARGTLADRERRPRGRHGAI